MPDDNTMNYLSGVSAFQNARMRAFWDEVTGLVRGKPAELLSFEDIRARLRLRAEDYKGMHEVPLEQIVGSVGRYNEFTRHFLPKRGAMQERWSRVYAQAQGMMGLPPIELYKVGDVYFVRDGNHRVSVARQMGAKTIQAHVTELSTSIALRPGMTEDELDAATAYAAFLDVTRLQFTRPHLQSILLSQPSRYDDLLGHIELHRAIMQQQAAANADARDGENEPIELEDAAADWYDNVYRPAVTLIRKYGILDLVPRFTEGDLYLWMIEHLRELQEQYGDQADARSFSDALVDYLKQKRIPIPKDLLRERDDTVEIARVDLDALPLIVKDRAASPDGD